MSVFRAPANPLVVSFRDARQPRASAGPLVASAVRHPRGWSLFVPGIGTTEHLTFDAAALTVTRMTGVTSLLIVWSGRDAT
jgi:hypothetical protein